MKRKKFLKRSQIVNKTTDRREYTILHKYVAPYEYDCGICPVKNCDKMIGCNPDRTFERNWKSQRKEQWK